jgi:hypothetical protein
MSGIGEVLPAELPGGGGTVTVHGSGFVPGARDPFTLGRACSQVSSSRSGGRVPDLLPRTSLLANLLDEGLGASSMRALVIHDLGEQPRLRVLGQDHASAHLERELHAF